MLKNYKELSQVRILNALKIKRVPLLMGINNDWFKVN